MNPRPTDTMKLDKEFARMIRASPTIRVCDAKINLLRKDETMMCNIVVGRELVHDSPSRTAPRQFWR
jgi:hypothetical protein